VCVCVCVLRGVALSGGLLLSHQCCCCAARSVLFAALRSLIPGDNSSSHILHSAQHVAAGIREPFAGTCAATTAQFCVPLFLYGRPSHVIMSSVWGFAGRSVDTQSTCLHLQPPSRTDWPFGAVSALYMACKLGAAAAYALAVGSRTAGILARMNGWAGRRMDGRVHACCSCAPVVQHGLFGCCCMRANGCMGQGRCPWWHAVLGCSFRAGWRGAPACHH
jgi:hypothetical protein